MQTCTEGNRFYFDVDCHVRNICRKIHDDVIFYTLMMNFKKTNYNIIIQRQSYILNSTIVYKVWLKKSQDNVLCWSVFRKIFKS